MDEGILQFVASYSFYTSLITFIFGIIGNALNLLVFTQLKLFWKNQSAFYLTIGIIADFSFHIANISLLIATLIYKDDAMRVALGWCKFSYIVGQFLILTSLSMICCAAIDQFCSTNYRLDLRQICTVKLSRYLTCVFLCISIIHSSVFSSFFNIQQSVGCVITNPISLQYSTYFFYPVLVGFLPIAIASLFSILAYRNVRRIVRRQIPIVRRRLDRQMTAMVLMRVMIFVCLQLPFSIYRIYAVSFPVSRDKPMEYAIGRLVQVIFNSIVNINYTVSFYVFVISCSRYRRQVKFLLKKYWQQLKTCDCHRNNRVGPDNGSIELDEIS